MLAAEKNRMHKVLFDAGVRLSNVVSDIHGVSARAMIEDLIHGVPPLEIVEKHHHRLKANKETLLLAIDVVLNECKISTLRSILKIIMFLENEIRISEVEIINNMPPRLKKVLRLMETVPGIDTIAAALVLVEIGDDMNVFGSAEQLASWAGLCPGNNESAGKRRSGRTRKGNRWLRRALCEITHSAIRTECYFRSKFQNLKLRRGYKRSVIAIAHKILRVLYFMISRGEPYRDKTVNYEELVARKNAPRWVRILRRFGLANVSKDNVVSRRDPIAET
jgi:transposase